MTDETKIREHGLKSNRASIISSLARFRCMLDGSDENLSDYRAQLDSEFDEIIESLQPDPTSWEHVKTKFFYDVYLMSREEEGTITKLDLIRSGLTVGQFADPMEFHKHCLRVGEARVKGEGDVGLTKVCTSCGEEKPAHKFKKRGGAKCNACRSKEYRERKNAA